MLRRFGMRRSCVAIYMIDMLRHQTIQGRFKHQLRGGFPPACMIPSSVHSWHKSASCVLYESAPYKNTSK